MKSIKNKNSNGGFSLGETLVAVLILSVITAAVATGIVSARNSYVKIVRKADAMTLLSTIAISMEADLSSAKNIDPSYTTTDHGESKTVIHFDSGIRKYPIYFDTVDGYISAVAEDLSGSEAEKIVIPVATDVTHTSNLTSELESLSYNTSEKYFEYTIVIRTKAKGTEPAKEILRQDYVTRVES